MMWALLLAMWAQPATLPVYDYEVGMCYEVDVELVCM